MAFEDINPVAPVHFLVVPKKPIQQLSKSEDVDQEVGVSFRIWGSQAEMLFNLLGDDRLIDKTREPN